MHGPVSGAQGPLPWDQSWQVLWAGHGWLPGLPASDVPREAKLMSLLISGASRPSTGSAQSQAPRGDVLSAAARSMGHRPAPPRRGCRHEIAQTLLAQHASPLHRPHFPGTALLLRWLRCGEKDMSNRPPLRDRNGVWGDSPAGHSKGVSFCSKHPGVGGPCLAPRPRQGDTQLCVPRSYVAPGTK